MTLWMAVAGKFCSKRSRAKAMLHSTDFTDITTWLNSSTSTSLQFFCRKSDIVLLQPKQCELGLVIRKHLHGVLPELPADGQEQLRSGLRDWLSGTEQSTDSASGP